ncbi:class I SAM-dependent methyltransferase [Echinicola sp. 20G]|uniref:class I SAM-dependent methyltransferase n=1 Tax=Echinicola sp. 20G TaxID=2781961 RepID=UPI001910B024|nr:class I SAM-dependent methyltransferase [Echinicola sp. 20G]
MINKLIPVAFKSKLYQYFTKKFDLVPRAHFEKMPIPSIEEKHISNLKALTNRETLIDALPKNGVIAEIGVDKGDYSQTILDITKPSKLHLIDVWKSERYPEKLYHKVMDRFLAEQKDGLIEINRGYSTDIVEEFSDEYFDWIYIDTAHSYEVTKAELEAYRQKVKKGGIIAGHDFIIGELEVPWKYGVIEAVYEFCNKYDWEIIYLTMERNIPPSFAIRAINL